MSQPTPITLFQAVIVGCLTPILAADSDTAQQAIDAYKPTGEDQSLTVAQIIAFALTGLNSVRLSMSRDLSASMKLKLRGNANALARSARQATFNLADQRRSVAAASRPADPENHTEINLEAAAGILASVDITRADPEAPAGDADRQIDLSWANAMTDVAAEFAAELDDLPPAERRAQLRRISALTTTARTLHRGEVPLKDRMFGGVWPRNSLGKRH